MPTFPTKIDLKPKRRHGFSVLLFILGTLLPPLAVAARFGIGTDFFINTLLTICGYIPGHAHNFYIQNIRNNKNHARTPKWAQRYGLVDTSEIRRKERKSQWANRYQDRLPHSTLEGQALEEGQEGGSSMSLSSDDHSSRPQQQNGALWGPEDERYYSANASSSSGGRWRYPANFDDAVLPSSGSKRGKKKKEKKDRWARTEDAYSISEQQSRKRVKKKKSRSSVAPSVISADDSTAGYPEDPEGGLYGNTQAIEEPRSTETNGQRPTNDDIFSHEF
ncbi:MAG: hypothetical protein NXY57DRAFT_81367 [Lentinula lateritia]|uniref:Uncharacterized protein n=1 Tax=Lentinula lateritia TaxID=40482 RepID=A0ABQ8VIQ2_9AGAR|nr:MAG: hypothetical protein NXY57DRAFT_81367 [Lentinula lateritia]KAJ4495528.1 hypothetical protein C8R41DRAFT_762413 [Lentinula lateritia]